MSDLDFSFAFVFTYVATYLFVALYCAVVLLRVSSDIGRHLEVRYFRFLVGSLALYCVTESIWAVGNFGYSDAINALSMPLTIVNSILVNAFCFFWFCYMESYLHSEVVNQRKLLAAASIPFALAVLLSLTTPWTGFVFYMDNAGGIARGPLYLLLIVLAYGYAAVATVRAIVGAVRTNDRRQRSELVTMSLFVIPPAIAGVIDTLMPLMPVVAPAFFFSFLIVFTMLQESQISTDSLTGLNNRRRADRSLDEAIAMSSEQDPFLLFLVDADQFKAINDTYGHLEGDRALCVIASALRDASRNTNAFIGRWGGDEFVVVVRGREVGSPEAFIEHLQTCLLYERHEQSLPCVLTASVGYAHCSGPDKTRRQVLEEADKRLYEAKRARQ